ncbi:MAG: hypothetical protein JWP57_1446 [Spirosoma sp.]|nr:hypothetical protein [Spirosoma sp.]
MPDKHQNLPSMLRFLARSEVDTGAWDACVAASKQRIIYGYSWYLDALTGQGEWSGSVPVAPLMRWDGLVIVGDAGTYRAVMPVPLRRKFGRWVVHQPLFCQFLSVFSRDEAVNPMSLLQAVQQQYRYGSILCLGQFPHLAVGFNAIRQRTTHVLDLSVGYEVIAGRYTRDRKLNLRRAIDYNWLITDSTDPEPLLNLFRTHHADGIDGGVGEWAYTILRRLIGALQQRGLATLRYALVNEQTEAGALFVQEGNRIIYLFNAASQTGRKGNARTLLIDQIIRERAGHSHTGKPLIFDFESPEKETVVDFYRSFSAVDDLFWDVRWNRLTVLERAAKHLLALLR